MYNFKEIEEEARKVWKKNEKEIEKAVQDNPKKPIFSFLQKARICSLSSVILLRLSKPLGLISNLNSLLVISLIGFKVIFTFVQYCVGTAFAYFGPFLACMFYGYETD